MKGQVDGWKGGLQVFRSTYMDGWIDGLLDVRMDG